MILGNSLPPLAYEQQLERLSRDGFREETDQGFSYSVVDAERLRHSNGVAGLINYGRAAIEINLIQGSDIPKTVRPAIADVCIKMALLRDEGIPSEYLLCDASRTVLTGIELELRGSVANVLYKNLREFQNWVRQADRAGHYRDVHPMDRRQLKHGLGTIALERPLDERGKELIDELFEKGLWVPSIDTKEVLIAKGKKALSGVEITLYSAEEKGHHHKCKSCSGEIHKGSFRITASYDKPLNGYDHHHYHPVCYPETDMQQIDLNTARIIKAPRILGN